MKISRSLLTVCLIVAAVFSGPYLLRVSALEEPMTDQQIALIRTNCVTAKNTLNQLHASDALLRVNMGQVYELMSTKLMNGFNGRVSSNHFNNANLISSMRTYNSTLDKFRSDYIAYEVHLSNALSINCLNQPVSFYDAVATSRVLRNKVYLDVVKLNDYIDQYDSAVAEFEKDYTAATTGVSL